MKKTQPNYTSNTGCYLYYYTHFVIKLSNASAAAKNPEAFYIVKAETETHSLFLFVFKRPHLSTPTLGS